MERAESEPGATQEGLQSSPTANRLKRLVGKKPANRRSAGQPPAARSAHIKRVSSNHRS